MFTADTLRRLWPHVDAAKPGLTDAVVEAAPAVFTKWGLTTTLTVAHAMAQFSEEFGADMPAAKIEFEENLSYSVSGLMKTWPSRFPTTASALPYAHSPQKLADKVYGGRMGNRPGTDDGWSFRGRGGSQVTGYDGYNVLAHSTGLDLLGSPDLVNDRDNFLECAVADFVQCGCLQFAEKDDIRGVTHHLNGGLIGLPERERWLERWKVALGHQEPATLLPNGIRYGDRGPEVKGVQEALVAKGYPIGGDPDGDFGDKTRAAVLAFQATEGLPTTGVVDGNTEVHLDTAPQRPIAEDRATATVADLRATGSTTVAHADNAVSVGKAAVIGGGGLATLGQSGLLDQVKDAVNQAGGLHQALDLVDEVVKWTQTHLWVALVAAGGAVWYFGRNIILARLADHRSGNNLGR